MKRNFFAVLLTFSLCAPFAAQATPMLVGNWENTWSQLGATADVDITITSQSGAGALAGYFDWTCTSGLICSGREFFVGSVLADSSFTLDGTSLLNPVNLLLGSYWGSVSLDGMSMSASGGYLGTRIRLGSFNVSRVPEPGSLALVALGLSALAMGRRSCR